MDLNVAASREVGSAIKPRLKAAGQHESEHAEIADERPPRMGKGGRPIAFNQEMPSPGDAVAHGQPKQSKPGTPDSQHDDKDKHAQHGAAGMQDAIHPLGVLLNVVDKKLVIVGEVRRWHGERSMVSALAER